MERSISAAKKANTAQAETHNYSEAETRDYFIDLLLKEAGWALDQERDREFPVEGMPNSEGKGFVDYVLWGDAGNPLHPAEPLVEFTHRQLLAQLPVIGSDQILEHHAP